MPTARQPQAFASCPTTLPTAPEAADTTTVSPGLGAQMSFMPKYAVRPGMPRQPRKYESDTFDASTLVRSSPLPLQYSCQPEGAVTLSPGLKPGCFDSTTSPAVSPVITSPISTPFT